MRRKKREGKGIAVLVTALLVIAAMSSVAIATDWPQFQHDVRHSGFSPSTVPDTDDLLWVSTTCAAGSWCEIAPVIADGKVFVYDPDGAMIAFDEATGSEVWRTTVYPATFGSWASPAYHDGNVFIGAGESTYCIDSDDGSIRWVFTYPSDEGCTVNGGPCIADGKVLVGDWGGRHYYCIDEGTGELLWTFVHEDTGSWGTAYAQGTPAYADGKVYLTFWEYVGGNVYCLNATTGEEIWHSDLPNGDTCGSPTVVDGTVYVTTYFTMGADGMIYALYENNGTIKWEHEIIRTDSTPAVAYGNVYVPCGCAGYSALRSYCLNATTGEEVWRADGIGSWTRSPAVADGKVVIGNYVLDAFTGDVLWAAPSRGESVVADGLVFLVGGGNVSAFGSLKPDISVAAIEVPEEIYKGSPATVNAMIRNDGFVDLDAFNLTLEVDDTIIETEMIDALPADSSVTVSFVWMPQSTGEHTLKVTADHADLIEETCEINNERTKDVTVTQLVTESYYGDSILSSDGVYNPTNALHEPGGACAGLSNGEILSIELEGIVLDSTGVSIWARWAGMQNALMPANFDLYVSTNGADWTKIEEGTVYRGDGWQPQRYNYSGNFGDVRYIQVAVNSHPWVGVDLDAVYAEG